MEQIISQDSPLHQALLISNPYKRITYLSLSIFDFWSLISIGLKFVPGKKIKFHINSNIFQVIIRASKGQQNLPINNWLYNVSSLAVSCLRLRSGLRLLQCNVTSPHYTGHWNVSNRTFQVEDVPCSIEVILQFILCYAIFRKFSPLCCQTALFRFTWGELKPCSYCFCQWSLVALKENSGRFYLNLDRYL